MTDPQNPTEGADVTPEATTPEATPEATTPEATTPETATPAGRPRPAAPGAAAARRARQLGGTRRPAPRPRPATADADDAADTDTATAAADATATTSLTKPTATRGEAGAAPKSSVGKAAARPRPRPRPTPTAEPTGDDVAAADTEDAAEGTAGRPRRARRGLVPAASVLTVLFLAAGVVFLVLTAKAKPQISAEETSRAVAAAKTDVALLTTYGYQTIDADAAKAAAVITGQFKQQYLDAVQTSVKPQLPTSQAVTTGQVDAAGLVSADAKGRQVVVLVYGQQAVTNKVQTTPRIDAFQVRVTMQQVDGRWLVSALEQLGNNA